MEVGRAGRLQIVELFGETISFLWIIPGSFIIGIEISSVLYLLTDNTLKVIKHNKVYNIY